METKIIELRDSGTTLIVLAAKFRGLDVWEQWAVARAGYGQTEEDREWYVLIVPLDGGAEEAHTDPHDWKHSRTIYTAHRWLRETPDAWDSVPASGGLIDVQVLLGETRTPKVTEFFTKTF